MAASTRPILVAGSWREARNPVGTFTAVEELWNRNPTGRMWRFVDGAWSQGDISA